MFLLYTIYTEAAKWLKVFLINAKISLSYIVHIMAADRMVMQAVAGY